MNLRTALVALAAVSLAACGSNGSTAEFKLMDAPPAGVTSVKVFVASLQAHVVDADKAKDADPADDSIDDDGSWQTLTVNKEIDLVQHQGETAAEVLGQLELPVGKITQIRLLIDTSKPNTATVDGADCNLDLSKVNAKGIKISHVFKAFDSKDGSKEEILVDFALDESLKAGGTCFVLEPKLKLHKVKIDGSDVQI